jgi:aldehyde:ferredoxin oxidoreductase
LTFQARQGGAEKAANVARHQDWRTLFNSLVICYFANVPPETLVNLVNAACGHVYKLDELLQTGERAWNLKRLINIRLGLRRENDLLPKALLIPLSAGGGTEGYVPPFEDMLEAYYIARDWDPQDGFPKREKLIELGLQDVMDDLEAIKKGQGVTAGRHP